MPFDALILDMDGTLADTNGAHVEAWQHAFTEAGYDVSPHRLWEEIGKGGDHFVKDIVGEECDERDGDRLRESHTRHFIEIARTRSLSALEGAQKLIECARNAGMKVALASSAKAEELEATEASTGIAWHQLFDLVTSSSDARQSKPSPDLITITVEKLGLSPQRCAFVGDTIFDAQACRRAGVTFFGVLTGPPSHDETRLRNESAADVFRDVADLLSRFDTVFQ